MQPMRWSDGLAEMDTTHDDPTHEQIRQDLGPYAFGTLDPPAAARLEAHLAACPVCAAALCDYQAVVRLLPLGLPVAIPPAGARSRLLERARASGLAVPLRPSGPA